MPAVSAFQEPLETHPAPAPLKLPSKAIGLGAGLAIFPDKDKRGRLGKQLSGNPGDTVQLGSIPSSPSPRGKRRITPGAIVAASVLFVAFLAVSPLMLFPFMPESFGLLDSSNDPISSAYDIEVSYDEDASEGDDVDSAAEKNSANSAASGATIDGKNAIVEGSPYSSGWIKHARKVFDSVKTSANSSKKLAWHGGTVANKGEDLGIFTLAIDVLNGQDYKIKSVYDYIVKVDPDRKKDSRYPHTCKKAKQHYGISSKSVDRSEITAENIKTWLSQGKLLTFQSKANKWLDDDANWFKWTGSHWGLVFYWDGKHFHVKAAGHKRELEDMLYTPEQLDELIKDGTDKKGILLYKSSGSGYNYTDDSKASD